MRDQSVERVLVCKPQKCGPFWEENAIECSWPHPIPVSEWLPEEDCASEVDTVLVWYDKQWRRAKWEGSKDEPIWHLWGDDDGENPPNDLCPPGSVKFWLPLPPPPE
jgi:hypothetical protein